MSSSSFDDLGHIDAVVARDVLVPHSACYTEAETWTRTRGVRTVRINIHSVSEACGFVLEPGSCLNDDEAMRDSLKLLSRPRPCNNNRFH